MIPYQINEKALEKYCIYIHRVNKYEQIDSLTISLNVEYNQNIGINNYF